MAYPSLTWLHNCQYYLYISVSLFITSCIRVQLLYLKSLDLDFLVHIPSLCDMVMNWLKSQHGLSKARSAQVDAPYHRIPEAGVVREQ